VLILLRFENINGQGCFKATVEAQIGRGLDRRVWHRVELVEDSGERVGRSAPGSDAPDEALREAASELWCDGVGEVGGRGRGRLLGILGEGPQSSLNAKPVARDLHWKLLSGCRAML
jgi:hypothetical protein